MQQRTRSHFSEHGKSFRFDANHSTLGLQSRSRSGSQHSGEGKFHLHDAADRQFLRGEYKCSRDTAVPRLAVAIMNTMIFSLPGESHRCRHRISVVMPLIHRSPIAGQPLCDKVRCTCVCLKTHKVQYCISPSVDFQHPCDGAPVRDSPTNYLCVTCPLKWIAGLLWSTSTTKISVWRP